MKRKIKEAVMGMSRAVYDPNVPTRNLITTASGVVMALVMALVAFNVVTPEQGQELQTHGLNLIEAARIIVESVVSIILIFKAKDA